MPRLVVRCTHLCRCRTRTFVAQAANVLLDAHGNAKMADFGKLRVLLGLVDRDSNFSLSSPAGTVREGVQQGTSENVLLTHASTKV